MQVEIFDTATEKFIKALNASSYAKTLRTIDLLKDYGHTLAMPHSRMVERGLFELRIKGRQAVRLFYVYNGEQAMILHGFIKKTTKTPRREIDVARTKEKGMLDVV